MSDTALPEWKIRSIAKETAKETVAEFVTLYGLTNVEEVRANNVWVKEQRDAAYSRRNEGRKMVFTVLGGLLLLAIGVYLGTVKMGVHP